MGPAEIAGKLKALEQKMYQHAKDLEFEAAAQIRDQILKLKAASLA
jgi:excinuclease ABC subunit B